MRKIKVLVVDDSMVFRKFLVQGLKEETGIEVVAEARDAFEARDAIIKYQPDVMTLDIEMPKMNGLEFLKKLLPQYPMPVVVVSALDGKVFDAMQAGAVDFVRKPDQMDRNYIQQLIKQELAVKIKIASTVKKSKIKTPLSGEKREVKAGAGKQHDIIAIGASTGGTEAIRQVIDKFGMDIPGIVIVQHMPPGFTEMYAQRLNDVCRITVKEAKHGDVVRPGQALLAPGDKHMRLIKVDNTYQVDCKPGEKVSGHCPSVDVLFHSVARIAGNKALGIILTGMGKDGSEGLLAMKKAGALTIGQNEESCIVYGMPKVAYDIGAVDYQLPLLDIPNKVCSLLK